VEDRTRNTWPSQVLQEEGLCSLALLSCLGSQDVRRKDLQYADTCRAHWRSESDSECLDWRARTSPAVSRMRAMASRTQAMRRNSRDLGWRSSITKFSDSSSDFSASDPDTCEMKGRLSSDIFSVRWQCLVCPWLSNVVFCHCEKNHWFLQRTGLGTCLSNYLSSAGAPDWVWLRNKILVLKNKVIHTSQFIRLLLDKWN
jgi:hypothetical protein